MSENKDFPMYKGRPLVRSGDTIYYGFMKDPYVVKIDIRSKKQVGNLMVADKVGVQLISTDPTMNLQKRIDKNSEKNGLYAALDIGETWLARKLVELEKK